MDTRSALGQVVSNRSCYQSLAVVGLGNIGGQTVRLLAAIPGIERVILIDHDRYDSANLGFQAIAASAVGRAKTDVQAGVLGRLLPDVAVAVYQTRFESVPLGMLRDCVVLCCVDNRAARQAINRAAIALSIPWIDAALAREGSVRARAFLPGAGACLECSWGERDYELLEQRLPCAGADVVPVATAAPLELGAIAAGMQMALLRRVHAADPSASVLADRQYFLDVPSGRGWTGRYAPNPECRLDHAPWQITELAAGSVGMTLYEALGLSGAPSDPSALSAPGMVFVERLRCPRCRGSSRVDCRLSSRLEQHACDECGAPLLAAAIDTLLQLDTQRVSKAVLTAPLSDRGLVAGDIVAIGPPGAVRHFQLA